MSEEQQYLPLAVTVMLLAFIGIASLSSLAVKLYLYIWRKLT